MKKYVRISALLPSSMMEKYKQQLIYANKKTPARAYVGLFFSISIVSAIIAFIVSSFYFEFIYSVLLSLSAFVFVMCLSYIKLVLAADKRAQQMEKVLPDALQLISANMRAGMTIDKALWLCARPEFGPFEKELRRMASETLSGKPVTEALMGMTERVKSKTLERAVRLLVEGIQLGGELAHLLTEVAADIRVTKALEKEISAATAMYTIFIIFASIVAAPLLFAVSTFYVKTTGEMWEQRSGQMGEMPTTDVAFISVSGGTPITGEEVKLFALSCIMISTCFGSLTIGMVKNGSARRGLKYVPIFVLTGLGIYFMTLLVIGGMFAGIAAM